MALMVMRSRWALGLLLGVAIWFGAAPAWAGEPPSEPILRIETGNHSSLLTKDMAVDRSGRVLVTGSEDKSIRVWDLVTGELVRTIRPPVGRNLDGRISQIAISPDGKLVAAGGFTGREWDGAASIYFFDLSSGEMRARVGGVPGTVLDLAYSKDGAYIAVAFSSKEGLHGVQVYRTGNYSIVVQDVSYRRRPVSVDFDPKGRLVTAAFDGVIRLYDTSFRVLEILKLDNTLLPWVARFSPDGNKIAVGYWGGDLVTVLSGQDLRKLYSRIAKLKNVMWTTPAWSTFDKSLVTTSSSIESVEITFWLEDGREATRKLLTDTRKGGQEPIYSLVVLPGRRVVVGMNGTWGMVDLSKETWSLYTRPSAIDFCKDVEAEQFRLSYDGTVAQIEDVGRFSPSNVWFGHSTVHSSSSTSGPDSYGPLLKKRGVSVTGLGTLEHRFNGAPLPLYEDEIPFSIGFAPDDQSFILGTSWYLRNFDSLGKERWRSFSSGSVCRVSVSRNNALAVIVAQGGTIHWYRMKDGQELLSLFPHSDRKRWVMWTPSGYYNASPGGEELIGWHVNHGKDQAADFFPAAKFRNTYYRPDIVAKVLETLDEGTAVRLANSESGRKAQTAALAEQLPPVVTILSPGEGAMVSASDVTVRFTLRSPSGEPVTGVKALVDGRPVSVARDLKVTAKAQAESDVQEFQVTIPERDAEIAILAENRYSTSVPAVVRVKWAGRGPGQADAFVIQPRLYILAIGVSQYQNKDLTLGFPAKDAQDFAAVLHSQKGRLYRDVTAKVLTDGEATKDDILDGLDWLRKETTSKDVAMLFLAGHGVNDSNGIYYFLLANANPDKLLRTGVVFSDIKNTLASIAGKTLFFVDTCHSGNIMGARRGVADINAVVNELASAENGAVVFASSTGKQYSLEDQTWGNGAFTKALVEGLDGKADYTGKGTISINMLDLYLSERVKQLTDGKQTPTTTKPNTVPDFPIALRR
ncbi:MAG: caspase family protein [Nitrospira defluvii]|nr:caspase family protein [Nitrospira defluvii]